MAHGDEPFFKHSSTCVILFIASDLDVRITGYEMRNRNLKFNSNLNKVPKWNLDNNEHKNFTNFLIKNYVLFCNLIFSEFISHLKLLHILNKISLTQNVFTLLTVYNKMT